MSDVWIFGYGSLVWRPAFESVERLPAVLPGYARRFWQGSEDHRGVPGAPGRVATLVEEAGARCAGRVYRVAAAQAPEVLARLDVREQGGYEQREVTLQLPKGRMLEGALVYLATSANPNWLGPAPLEQIARQVRASRGPSGPNAEYVLRLCEALRAMGEDDEHCFALEALLRRETTSP